MSESGERESFLSQWQAEGNFTAGFLRAHALNLSRSRGRSWRFGRMAAGPPGSVHLSTARLPVCHSKTRAERRQSGWIGRQPPARPPNSSAAHRTKYAMCAASAAFGRDRSGALGAPRPWWWWWTGTNSRAHTACCRYSRRSVARFHVHCCYFVLWSCHGGKRGGYMTLAVRVIPHLDFF